MKTRKKIIGDITVSMICELEEEIESWLSLISDKLEGLDLAGSLFLAGPAQDDASTGYWLARAFRRDHAKACFYDTGSDSLIPYNWRWKREGAAEEACSLPIIPVGSKKTLFLDRDGVINKDNAYVYEAEKFEFMDGIFDLLTWAKEEDYQVIVLTNQSGVGKGFYKESDVMALHEWVDEQLGKRGLEVEAWFYSPFHPDSPNPLYRKVSYSRKPGSGMAIMAAQKLSIDFEKSFMVGDKVSDRLKDLDMTTFFIQGPYDLQGSKNIFSNHGELISFLKEEY